MLLNDTSSLLYSEIVSILSEILAAKYFAYFTHESSSSLQPKNCGGCVRVCVLCAKFLCYSVTTKKCDC